MFADNPIYREYEALLINLDRLMAEGRDETEEGESLRDRLESLHWKLTKVEQDRLRGLSADLFMLQNDEIAEPLEPGWTSADLEDQTREAWEQQGMERLLTLLRKRPTFLSEEAIASLRSYAYEKLGHLQPALLFKRHAAQLNPGELGHRIGLMELYYRLGMRDEAASEARKIISDPHAAPGMVAVAGYILSKVASALPEEQGENSFATARHVIEEQNQRLLTAA